MSKAIGSTRLRAALVNGNLRVSDLARWFGVPYPTMRSWVKNGCKPRMAPQDADALLSALDKLEKRIAAKQGFPIPLLLPPSERIRRIKCLR